MNPEQDISGELSIEQIRSRMKRNAMKIWGADEAADPDSSFDPLVIMMIDACAFELKKIHSELRLSQTRVLNRLAQILSPEVLVGPQPAHTIIHARSVEPQEKLARTAQLYATKRIPTGQANKDVNRDIFFSPLMPTPLLDADIRYVAVGNDLFEYKSPVSRIQLSEGIRSDHVDRSVMWIGMEMNTAIHQLGKIPFFFDWKTDPNEAQYLQMLPLTRWSIGEKALTTSVGIAPGDFEQSEIAAEILSTQHDSMHRLEKSIEAFYAPHFLTVDCGMDESELRTSKCSFPPEWTSIFPKGVLERIQGSFVWFRVKFSGTIPPDAIRDLYVSINSFPAVNRKLNRIIHRLNGNLNIVPLRTEDLFLDLQSVENSDGNPFLSNPLSSGFRNESGYYTLRYGGLERFDNRHATELLEDLMSLLRDENAAFGALGGDFVQAQVTQISQAIALIENNLERKGAKGKPTNFLLVSPFIIDESIYVDYWTTNGTIANGFKSGTKLLNYSKNDLRQESLIMITTSLNARDRKSENERIMAYKQSLVTHDRIVTEHDIRSTCVQEMGDLINQVEIRKGWDIPLDSRQGVRRIQEVVLYPSSVHNLDEEEWLGLARRLELRIMQQSANVLPVKVTVAKILSA